MDAPGISAQSEYLAATLADLRATGMADPETIASMGAQMRSLADLLRGWGDAQMSEDYGWAGLDDSVNELADRLRSLAADIEKGAQESRGRIGDLAEALADFEAELRTAARYARVMWG